MGQERKQDRGILDLRSLLRETVHSYVFWSLIQGLGPMIWFYPLNELEISGYEAFAVMYFAPILTGLPGVLSLIQRRWILGLLRLFSLASLASFQAPSTLSRLAILAFGTGSAMLIFTASLWNPSARIRLHTFWGLILGLFTFLSSRVWFRSFVPTWWCNTTNSALIAIGAIAVIDHLLTGADDCSSEPKLPRSLNAEHRPHWFLVSSGFGTLLYLTHWVFGEVSLITRWTVRGYPDNGPQPYPWGAPVLLALLVGVLLTRYSRITSSKLWWLIGSGAFASLYYLPTCLGYTGGLILAVYTISIWPEMVHRLTACPPARSMVVAMIIYLIEIFFFVWTVAYNFVPGGVYTREHTDWLICAMMVFIFLGFFLGKVQIHPSMKRIQSPTKLTTILLISIVASGLAGFGARWNSNNFRPLEKEKPQIFSAAIWTYHFGYDNKGWPSLERTATLLNNTGADVITLLESDASKPFLGNNDLGMWLGEKLGMYVDFGPSTKDHTWGNLLLSKYPFVKSTHHLLPSPHGELAPAITATVNMSGSLVDFVVTHMGNDRDRLDRKLQAKFLSMELKNSENPVVFLGYVTSEPYSQSYRQLTEKGQVKDIDDSDMDRWCEYIMYRGLKRLGYARISHGGLSDTEVQVAKFEIPEDPKSYRDNTRLTTDPTKVNESIKFNSVFGSFYPRHGYFTDNRFHMSTPKYFIS